MQIVLCCASHSDEILNGNLARSPCVTSGAVRLHVERGAPSASVAYNRALAATSEEIVVFVHHDVYLPQGWDRLLRARLAELPGDWALYGTYGIGLDEALIGPVWSSSIGILAGRVPVAPVEVQSFDELLFVMRRSAGIGFDEGLPGWHLYGTDIVTIARAAGYRAYAGALPVIHNDRYHEELGSDFTECYRYMQRKWWDRLPLRTAVTKISRSGFYLWKEGRKSRRAAAFRAGLAVGTGHDPAFLARRCGWADLGPSA